MSYLKEQLLKLPPEKKWLFNRAEDIKNSPDGAKRWLKDLGKNDFEHAQTVEEYVGKILIESQVKLCPEEIYLLLHSIYTHDVGYRSDPKKHAENSYTMITKSPESYFIHDDNLGKAIALIGLTHGVDDVNDVPDSFPIDFLSKTKEFNLRFLGSLLLLGDELDQGYLRVFNRTDQERSLRKNVYHIEIGPQIVKLKTKPSTQDEWEELRKVTDHIQKRLEEVRSSIVKRGIKLEQISLYPTVWAGQKEHKEQQKKYASKPIKKIRTKLLFLLDRTVLGAEILQYIEGPSTSLAVFPVLNPFLSKLPFPLKLNYSAIIWMLGEDFEIPVSVQLIEKIIQNTKKGGGLVLFPFVAWSVSQGINEIVDELLPVKLRGGWFEGKRHEISSFRKHIITSDLKPFTIKNTYEWLETKPNAQCIISDSKTNPILTISSYGKGKVAYLNMSSHLCMGARTMMSPWQQSPFVKEIVTRTIKWVCEK